MVLGRLGWKLACTYCVHRSSFTLSKVNVSGNIQSVILDQAQNEGCLKFALTGKLHSLNDEKLYQWGLIMNEFEKEKEYSRFRRLDKLSKIGWLLSFRIFNPKRWWDREPQKFHGEPPLVSLARLAEKGLQNEDQRLDKENLERVLELFANVVKKDGIITEEENGIIRRYILEHGVEGLSEEEITEYIQYIERYSDHPLQLKNILHLLKNNINIDQSNEIVSTLYRFAYFYGVESKQSKAVSEIAIQLGLSFTDIRYIVSKLNREIREDNNGNITG